MTNFLFSADTITDPLGYSFYFCWTFSIFKNHKSLLEIHLKKVLQILFVLIVLMSFFEYFFYFSSICIQSSPRKVRYDKMGIST